MEKFILFHPENHKNLRSIRRPGTGNQALFFPLFS
jgi:hypothetical protein